MNPVADRWIACRLPGLALRACSGLCAATRAVVRFGIGVAAPFTGPFTRLFTRLFATLLASALLAGCASPPAPPAAPATLLADHLFQAPAQPVDPERVFAVSAAMRSYVQEHIEPMTRRVGAQRALLDALYTRGQLRLDYDTTRTRNAAEAFDARSGNCLSLLIMTGAFARELGLRAQYRVVLSEEAWDRADDLHFFIGHVNIRLWGGLQHRSHLVDTGESLVIDFLPGQNLARQRVREIDESRVLAMYMNNRAAESLAAGQIDDAYAWLRAALQADASYHAAWNTLGVIYLRRGAPREAEAALRWAHGREADNPHVLGNLGIALQRQGREAEAEQYFAEQRRLQPVQPFALFREGLKAMREGRYAAARRLFEREIGQAPDYHEFHYWLAQAHAHLGNGEDARRHLELALANSTTRAQQGLYAGKLERLKAAKPL